MSATSRILASLLSGLALAGPACAQPSSPAKPAPTLEQLKAWKSRVIAPFKSAIYLDEKGEEMREADFMRTLHDERAPYKMDFTYVEGRKEKVVLQLLPPGAADKPAAGQDRLGQRQARRLRMTATSSPQEIVRVKSSQPACV